jgi:glycosidase
LTHSVVVRVSRRHAHGSAACAYWIRAFDVDGFRVDAAWGPRQRASEFWPRWREELKRIKPDLLLLAEASARDPLLHPPRL